MEHAHLLTVEDRRVRVQCAQNHLRLLSEDFTLINRLWFSDEAYFELDGDVYNPQNFRYWDDYNPHFVVEEEQYPRKVCVWAAIGKDGIIGPIFDPVGPNGTVTGPSYLHLLQTALLPGLQDKGVANTAVFMQDGAPPHYALIVRDWLNANFHGRWMGRKGSARAPTPIQWPPYSPDITPCDFFLWGHVKEQVYSNGMPNSLEGLRDRIREAFAAIPQEMVNRAIEAYRNRLQRCIDLEGQSVEHGYVDEEDDFEEDEDT
jgi:hypothetical protein